MKNLSQTYKWFSNYKSFKFFLLILLLFTSLGIFNGCKQLGIRENEKKGIAICGENYGEETDDERKRRLEIETERKRRLEAEKERLKYTFTFESVPNKDKYYYSMFVPDKQRKFQESSFTFQHYSHKLLSNIIFIAHKEKFDETFQEFKYELQSLNGPYKLYIYLATKNLLYVEKITDAIANSNVELYHISVHSNEPSWYYIKGKGVLESIFLTGKHEVMGVENSLKVKEIYINSNEELREFTCNFESTTVFHSNGKVKNESVFPNVFGKPKSLQTLDIRNSELEEMPDLRFNESMDIIKFYNVRFKEIDLNKLPRYTRKFEMSLLNEPEVILPSTQKSLRHFSINPKDSIGILQTALEKMKE